jgi:hypothetical protein
LKLERLRRQGINSLAGNPKSTEGTQRTVWYNGRARLGAHRLNGHGAGEAFKERSGAAHFWAIWALDLSWMNYISHSNL